MKVTPTEEEVSDQLRAADNIYLDLIRPMRERFAKAGQRTHPDGFCDDPMVKTAYREAVAGSLLHSRLGDLSWVEILSTSTLGISCQPENIRSNLAALGAVVMAWLDDIDNRGQTPAERPGPASPQFGAA